MGNVSKAIKVNKLFGSPNLLDNIDLELWNETSSKLTENNRFNIIYVSIRVKLTIYLVKLKYWRL